MKLLRSTRLHSQKQEVYLPEQKLLIISSCYWRLLLVTGRVNRSIVFIINILINVEVWETPPGYFLTQDGPLVVDLDRHLV